MQHRTLGRSGISVSEISLGCSGFWGNRRFSEREAMRIVHQAFDLGINLFDTGHNYSNYNAEPRLGKAVREILKSNDRDRIVLSSKAGTIRPRSLIFESRIKDKHTDFSPTYIETACARSIANLNCDHLDIFQLHGISAAEVTDELLSRLASMKRRGMFRLLGINTHRSSDMIFAAALGEIFDVALIDVNVLQLDRLPIIEKLQAAGIGVLAGTVLAQGHIIDGKIGRISRIPDVWYLARALLKSDGRRFAKTAPTMRGVLAAVDGMTPAQAAMAYVLTISGVASCVFGTTSGQNLRDVAATSGRPLSDGSVALIRSTFDALPEIISI